MKPGRENAAGIHIGAGLSGYVAEIGSHYLAEDLGLPSGLHDSHANYIGSWLQVLKNDPQAIILASNLAEKAATYLTAKVADHKAPDIALAA